MTEKRKRGRPKKPSANIGTRMQIYITQEIASKIRERGGSRYIAKLVEADALKNPS